MSKTVDNLIDKTVLTTPKPCASSTVERKEILRKIDKKYGVGSKGCNSTFEENQNDSSLGIIYDIDEKEDISSLKTGKDSITSLLQKQRQLAQSTLEKSKIGLPSKFLVPSDTPRHLTRKSCNNSTINESDLLRARESDVRVSTISNNFNPSDISTPRSSKPFYTNINEISKKIRNSDISLKDLCSEINQFSLGNLDAQLVGSDIDSGMFTPAELMEDKLLRDELSWRKEKDIPAKLKNISNLSSFNASGNYAEKYSVGNFFKARSEDMDHEFFKKSPSKQDPIPLVDLTNTSDTDESENQTYDSIMSVTQIAKILSEYGSQDTPRILNCLLKGKTSSQFELNSTTASERDVDDFISANKLSVTNKITSAPLNYNQNGDPIDVERGRDNLASTHIGDQSEICENLDRFNLSNRNTSKILQPTSNINAKKSISPHSRNSNEKKCNNGYLDTNSVEYLHATNLITSSPTENKENISDGDRSLTSVRSGSSLDTLPEGKFPIKSNRLELVWGCLKPGRTSIQEFQIRNQLNQRIRMQASITGSSFRIVKDCFDSEMLTVTAFVLRPLETKSFSIMFCPIITGAAAEKINFYPILLGEIQHSKRQVLTLFGYGGHVNCDITNVAKDSNGKLWFSLGRIKHPMYVQQKFVIKNNGNLFAFGCLDIISKGPFTFSELKIEPSEFIIKPQGEIAVTIRYCPSKSDLKYLNKMDIVEVGHVKIITGAEATRGRIRRLCIKLKQKDTIIDPLIQRLSEKIPGEHIPHDLKYLKESVSAMKDLLQQLTFREVTVTIEQDLESTLVNPIMDMEETSMYQTLYQDESNCSRVGDLTIIRKNDSKLFRIEPASIMLTLPMKQEDTILLYSESSLEMPFEIKTDPDSVLGTYPVEGVIGPYETAVIKVFCRKLTSNIGDDLGRILVYVENDVMDVIVKTVFIKSK